MVAEFFDPPPLVIPDQMGREIAKVVDLVDPNQPVSIEGTPLYMGRPWDGTHDFGINVVSRALHARLTERSHSPVHIAMIDDFTTGIEADSSRFTANMHLPAEIIHCESAFKEAAEEALRHLKETNRTMGVAGEILLNGGTQPRLRVKSGRVSCELLDACFQLTKGPGTHIIVHPKEFGSQQEGVRDILKTLHGGRMPATFINIFFKPSGVLSRMLITNTYGKTTNL